MKKDLVIVLFALFVALFSAVVFAAPSVASAINFAQIQAVGYDSLLKIFSISHSDASSLILYFRFLFFLICFVIFYNIFKRLKKGRSGVSNHPSGGFFLHNQGSVVAMTVAFTLGAQLISDDTILSYIRFTEKTLAVVVVLLPTILGYLIGRKITSKDGAPNGLTYLVRALICGALLFINWQLSQPLSSSGDSGLQSLAEYVNYGTLLLVIPLLYNLSLIGFSTTSNNPTGFFGRTANNLGGSPRPQYIDSLDNRFNNSDSNNIQYNNDLLSSSPSGDTGFFRRTGRFFSAPFRWFKNRKNTAISEESPPEFFSMPLPSTPLNPNSLPIAVPGTVTPILHAEPSDVQPARATVETFLQLLKGKWFVTDSKFKLDFKRLPNIKNNIKFFDKTPNTVQLLGSIIRVGSGRFNNEIVLNSANVGNTHCIFFQSDNKWFVEANSLLSVSSSNGTTTTNVSAGTNEILDTGDKISFEDVVLQINIPSENKSDTATIAFSTLPPFSGFMARVTTLNKLLFAEDEAINELMDNVKKFPLNTLEVAVSKIKRLLKLFSEDDLFKTKIDKLTEDSEKTALISLNDFRNAIMKGFIGVAVSALRQLIVEKKVLLKEYADAVSAFEKSNAGNIKNDNVIKQLVANLNIVIPLLNTKISFLNSKITVSSDELSSFTNVDELKKFIDNISKFIAEEKDYQKRGIDTAYIAPIKLMIKKIEEERNK